MHIKDRLESIRIYQIDIERLEEQLIRLDEKIRMMSSSVVTGFVSKSADNDQITEPLSDLIELRDTYAEWIDEYSRAIKEQERIIQKIKSPQKRKAVSLRYVSGKSIREIAHEMNYSLSGVRYLIDTALEELN